MSGGDLPTGTVAFLFTDIEGSTQLLRALGRDYSHLIAEHHRLLNEAFEATRAVSSTTRAIHSSPSFREFEMRLPRRSRCRGTRGSRLATGCGVRVRIGLHAGEPQVVGDRYVGLGVHRAARISAAAHGGQVLLSEAAASLLADNEPADVSIRPLGEYRAQRL